MTYRDLSYWKAKVIADREAAQEREWHHKQAMTGEVGGNYYPSYPPEPPLTEAQLTALALSERRHAAFMRWAVPLGVLLGLYIAIQAADHGQHALTNLLGVIALPVLTVAGGVVCSLIMAKVLPWLWRVYCEPH